MVVYIKFVNGLDNVFGVLDELLGTEHTEHWELKLGKNLIKPGGRYETNLQLSERTLVQVIYVKQDHNYIKVLLFVLVQVIYVKQDHNYIKVLVFVLVQVIYVEQDHNYIKVQLFVLVQVIYVEQDHNYIKTINK